MEIQEPATARALESDDAQIVVGLFADGIQLSIENSVTNQYGRQIKATVLGTLEHFDVENDKIAVNDEGALKCTLKARVGCAVFRGCGASEKNIPWGGMVRRSKDRSHKNSACAES